MLHLSILATWKQTWVFFSLLCIFIVSKGRKTHTVSVTAFWFVWLLLVIPAILTPSFCFDYRKNGLPTAEPTTVSSFWSRFVAYRCLQSSSCELPEEGWPTFHFLCHCLFVLYWTFLQFHLFLVFKGKKKIVTYTKYHDLNVTFYTW